MVASLALLLVLSPRQLPAEYEQTISVGHKGALLSVTMVIAEFDPSRHRVVEGDRRGSDARGFSLPTLVDGKAAYGAGGGTPGDEIASLVVAIGDKRFRIPKSLYEDCYNPNFDEGYTVWLFYKPDHSLVRVKMLGSDGGGIYKVIWTVTRSGKFSRRFYPRD